MKKLLVFLLPVSVIAAGSMVFPSHLMADSLRISLDTLQKELKNLQSTLQRVPPPKPAKSKPARPIPLRDSAEIEEAIDFLAERVLEFANPEGVLYRMLVRLGKSPQTPVINLNTSREKKSLLKESCFWMQFY